MSTSLRIGNYWIRTVETGTFRLDGGAMFGSVPKVLWEKKAPADAQNRIRLATRSLWIEEDLGDSALVDGRRRALRILVDVGNGDKFDEKSVEMFAIDHTPVSEWGVEVGDLSDIILTHLHFDHAGAMTAYAGDQLELAFPHVQVHIQRANLENARAPTPKERGSYLRENVESLGAADLNLLDGDTELFPGIELRVADGHTRGLQWVLVEGKLAYPSDLIPTSKHLHLPWIMGYDRCAEKTLEEKRAFLERAVAQGWIVVFEHDPEIPAATIARDDRGRYVIDEVVEI